MDPFKSDQQENYPISNLDNTPQFPDFNTQWMPQFEEGVKTKLGSNIEKGTDIIKKASNLYLFAIGLVALLMILPPLGRLMYEFSKWSFDFVGKIFP